MKYEIYFELYGKKMKTTLYADSESDAKKLIRKKIVFHKIEEVAQCVDTSAFDDIMGTLMGGKPRR